MKLSIFKDDTDTLVAPAALDWARLNWRQSLDKGFVPSDEFLQLEWLKEYPQFDFPAIEVCEWTRHLQGAWLEDLLQLEELREIFAHGPDLIEAIGNSRSQTVFPLAPQDWSLWVETQAIRMGADFNFTTPCTSIYWRHLDTPWRVTLLHGSIAGTTKVFFRRLSASPRKLEDFGLDAEGAAILQTHISERENMLVAGSTGSGKTTFLTSLLGQAEEEDHLVILEDTQEISCEGARVTRLLARPQVSLSDLLAHTLRLSPDRIVLGEMRSHEVVPFLLAMNTGHKGVMGTLHASSAMDSIHRVAQLFTLASGRKEMDYSEVLKLVAKNVGVVVFLEKRKVKTIIRVYGCEEGQPLYDVLWEN